MKLSEAIFKMAVGDRFEFLSGSNFITKTMDREFQWRVDGASFTVGDYLDYCDNEGEIIRDEQKVLTVEQMVTVLNISLRDTSSFLHSGCYKGAIDRADKNGQIKEWKRLKPLIDSIANWQICPSDEYWALVLKEYKNLTPPWEPEK